MPLDFYDPPSAILATGDKRGVEIGGSKLIVSIDRSHNFYNSGTIYTEMSWAAFYQEEGLEDQIDTFTTREYDSIREDPEALVDVIVKIIYQIINNRKIFYGIADFEVDAFLGGTTTIPGLDLDYKIINKLLEAHKLSRERNEFPKIILDDRGVNKIKIEFQGENKRKVHIPGSKLEDLINTLRMAKGFAMGLVCTSRSTDTANLYLMSDNLVFEPIDSPPLYNDIGNIKVIEYGIKKKLLVPISWFRLDVGIKSLETLELWDEIRDKPELKTALDHYETYINGYVIQKFTPDAQPELIGKNLEEDFYNMTPKERKRALKEMEKAIRFLTKEYKD